MAKIEKLNFYIVEDEYIEYVSKWDIHIAHNKKNKRPYVGIVLKIEGFSYFSPMFSPKKQHERYKENKTTSFYKKLCCNFKLLEEKLADY